MQKEVVTYALLAILAMAVLLHSFVPRYDWRTLDQSGSVSIVVYDKAAELILQRSMAAAVTLLPEGQEIVVYKNNSDGKGNSYGTHENYLVDRAVPFAYLVRHLLPDELDQVASSGSVSTTCDQAPGGRCS